MKIKARHLDRLLLLLSEKTGESLDRAGLRNMATEIGGIGEDYLYKKVFYAIRDLDGEESLSLRDAQLNSVAKFAGFRNINAFVAAQETPNDEQLRSLVGAYQIFVRQNSLQGKVFQSPAVIREKSGKFVLQLSGPLWSYEGVLKVVNGCLFVLLVSPEEKSFYHIYKIGSRRSPLVVQGIFSGVSTAFDPIGGRVVLLRVKEHTEPVNQAFSLAELRASGQPALQKLAFYFRDYARNNLSINKIISFGLEDLEDES